MNKIRGVDRFGELHRSSDVSSEHVIAVILALLSRPCTYFELQTTTRNRSCGENDKWTEHVIRSAILHCRFRVVILSVDDWRNRVELDVWIRCTYPRLKIFFHDWSLSKENIIFPSYSQYLLRWNKEHHVPSFYQSQFLVHYENPHYPSYESSRTYKLLAVQRAFPFPKQLVGIRRYFGVKMRLVKGKDTPLTSLTYAFDELTYKETAESEKSSNVQGRKCVLQHTITFV